MTYAALGLAAAYSLLTRWARSQALHGRTRIDPTLSVMIPTTALVGLGTLVWVVYRLRPQGLDPHLAAEIIAVSPMVRILVLMNIAAVVGFALFLWRRRRDLQ